jgi:hypothetical protein
MRAKEFTNKLYESLDKPYPLTWNYDKEAQGEISAETVLDDGTPFIIAFYSKTTPGEYTVAFSRNYEVGTTDLGLEFRVFATALDGIKTFIKKRWPISIKFITVKEEDPLGKRDKLYKSIIRRNADTLGYHLEISDQPHVVVYYFKRINVGSKKQGVAEDTGDKNPQWLYHATYRPLLKSIKAHGLGGDRAQAKWEDSKPGVVYLALDPNVAESYAESSDVVPEDWLDQIVILKIAASKLDKSRLFIDQNVQDNQGDTLEYHGVIPFSNISLYKKGVAEDIDYQRHLKLINAHMKKMGYRRLGGGRDAQVYAKQEGNIIKILIPQDGKTVRSAEIPFLEFYKYCRANQKNPHLPKFGKIQGQDYADFHLDGERFVQIAQERLSDIPAPSEYDDMLFDMINSVENNTPLEQQYPSYELFYKTLKSVAQRGRELGFENDFIKSDDDFNIMLRGKTLVITDPWLDASLNESVAENFADGRNPGRKGLSRRVGIPKKATLGQLEKIAKSSTGERRRMAQWQLNMRRGRNKKK